MSCLFDVSTGYFPGKIDPVGKFIEEHHIVLDDGDFRRGVHRDEFIVLPDTETQDTYLYKQTLDACACVAWLGALAFA